MEFLCTLSQKNSNSYAQGIRILDSKPVLETSLNFTKNFWTRKWDLTTKYLSKKALKLTYAEKHKLLKILLRVGVDKIWLKLVWDTWDHPRSWFSLTILFDPRWLQENRDCFHLLSNIKTNLKFYCIFFQKSLQDPIDVLIIIFENNFCSRGFKSKVTSIGFWHRLATLAILSWNYWELCKGNV